MLNIPEEKLPKEFKDEARLDSLFSPFRSRTVNPRDWDTKIASWKHLIYLYCTNNGVYSFNLVRLNKLFIRHGRPPSCLNIVLEELVKSGELQYLEDFLKQSPKNWSGWATDLLVKRPLIWGYNSVKRTLFTSQASPERCYVYLEVIKDEAQKVLTVFSGKYRNKVINFSEFLQILNKDLNQADDVNLLLHYLIQGHNADMTTIKNNSGVESVLVKISDRDKEVLISEIDVAMYVLQENEKLFTKHVENLEDEIAHCIKEVKIHLLKGHRQLAKTCLKKKHEMEKRLTHKTNALHNVHVLVERLKDVHTDAAVWQSYKQAFAAFNNTVEETGLTEDGIEDTMLKLGEMLDLHEDIQSAVSRPVALDDADLEDELAELMKVEEKSETSATSSDIEEQLGNLNLSDLPEVSSANVSVKEAS